ncbi:MAG: DNA mismatch repair protein MutS [Chitinophagaceae bacterium]|nr:DNA mismatch repair protein MutS [Chitinophagaceae bacterium]MCW5904685.1 DNA mismatch repair protein MutS [Chitinophagaceae bacterium]
MQIDKTTLSDLSIFNTDESLSVFHFLNHTTTIRGKKYLHHILSSPLTTIDAIRDTQNTIQQLQLLQPRWKHSITNGTLMVLEKFYETAVNDYPEHANNINSFLYKLFSKADFSLTKYSVTHCITFIKGMKQIQALLQNVSGKKIQYWNEKIHLLLNKSLVQEILQTENVKELSNATILQFALFLQKSFRHNIHELIDIFIQLDAYISLATACTKNNFVFPEIKETPQPFIEVEALYHPLLEAPVSSSFHLNHQQNFLFLTGANMAGKSTFIKAVGIGTYLAQLGMGVPAKKMNISLFNGLLSNIQIADNIIKGESYFFNEVQRIKNTIEQISDGKNWLILIDELFKGTNVQDAMKCSTIVIDGLRKMNNALFILSTHLYEIADDLQKHNNIQFKYFETAIKDEQLIFSYQLKDGISNDRLGYLILKKEGVVNMLDKLQ